MFVPWSRRRSSLLACGVGLVFCSAVSAQAEPVRHEVRASAVRASDQSSAALAVRPDGAAAVAWVGRRMRGGYDAVCLQRYDPAGRAEGGERLVWSGGPAQQRSPSITFLGDHLFAAWMAFDPVDGWRSYLRRVGGAHEPIALGAAGASSPSVEAHGPAVAVVWVERGDDAARVMFQRFTDQGAAVGLPLPLSSEHERAALPSLATLSDGRAVVVWAVQGVGAGLAGLRARFVSPGGSPSGAVVLLPGAAGEGDVEPAVAATAAGGFAVAWMKATAAAGHDVWFAAYDRDGAPVSAARRANSSPGEHSGATVTSAPDGRRLCVAWNVRAGAELGAEIRARWFHRSGVPAGEPFAATEHREGHQQLVAAANRRSVAAVAGGLVLAWSGDGGLGDASAAHVTWIAPSHSALASRLVVADPGSLESPRPALTGALAPHDPPTFEGAKAQARGSANLLDGSGFEAITDTGWLPPDPHMAAGPDHVVAVVNGGIGFFAKDGTRTFFQTISGGGGFWGSVGASSFVFDPRVLFDPHSGRWLVMAAEHRGSSSGYILLAVSDDDDPNGDWHRYRWDLTSQLGSYFIDFPHIGVDERAVYVSCNVFQGNTGHVICVLDKSPLLVGAAVSPVLLKVKGLGSAAMGAQFGASAAGYLVRATYNSLEVHAVTGAPTNPQVVSSSVKIPRVGSPATAPQRGTSVRLDPVDIRLASTTFINGRLYCAHNTDRPVRVRWYELQIGDWPNSGPAPSLVQSGGMKAGESSTFLPSIQADAYGNILVGCSKSSPIEYVSSAYFYRTPGDPVGTMRGPFTAKASTSPYTENSRWGDYGGAALDPRDRATFWSIHEWARDSRTWSTWIEAHRVQPPTLTSNISTVSAVSGGTMLLTLDNPAYANRNYVMLAGGSGSSPGFRLPTAPGVVNMDLNIDGVTVGLIQSMGSPMFQNFVGTLDADGSATATFAIPPAPFLAGFDLWFAYAQDSSAWDFASETVQLSVR